ncbi:hypothetical protein ACRYCC_43365 [Actinomadura scrupuli]|uniref:hypothetical protein n=1 Tax=Actinomadura scrupuli TaxID=559629 RepID=UPI003D99D096
MIILSGILVVFAIALLVAGIVTGADGVGSVQGLTLIYVSIAVSIVSALCLAIGVFVRRKELFGAGAGAAPARAGKPAKGGKPGKAARQAKGAKGAKSTDEADGRLPDEPEETVTLPSQPLDVPADATVFVVRGRKRYHLESCRQLTGRDKEDLTYAEALEEGFSPCTACMPDTALAARAAMSGEPAAQAGTGDRSGTAGLGKGTRAESASTGLAAAARPARGSSRASTPATAGTDDQFASDRPGSGGFGASQWESRPGVPASRGPLAAPSAYAAPAEPAADAPEEDSPGRWESDRELGVPSWAQSPTGRLGTGRPEREAESRTEEADTAELGVVSPRTTEEDEAPAPSRPSSVWTTSPVAPSALDLPAEPAAPPVTLEFTAAEPKVPSWATDDDPEEPPAAEPEDDAPRDAAADAFADDVPEAADEPAPGEPDTGHTAAEAAAEPEPAQDDTAEAGSPQVRILSGTRRYHRPDCALIEDIGDEAEDLESLSRDEAKERGCTPCLVCQPDKAHTAD